MARGRNKLFYNLCFVLFMAKTKENTGDFGREHLTRHGKQVHIISLSFPLSLLLPLSQVHHLNVLRNFKVTNQW